MKKSCMIMACVTLSLIGYSQTNQSQVEKQFNDPQRKANAGKADVIIIDKKNIFDSTTFDNNAAEPAQIRPVKAGARQKHCASKTKKDSKGNALKKSI